MKPQHCPRCGKSTPVNEPDHFCPCCGKVLVEVAAVSLWVIESKGHNCPYCKTDTLATSRDKHAIKCFECNREWVEVAL